MVIGGQIMSDIRERVLIGYDVGTNDDESCVTIFKGLNLEAAFHGKDAIAVLNLYNQFQERETKLVEALKALKSSASNIMAFDLINATLQSLGIQEES